MGEYTLTGEKLGTCESLYYIRFDEMLAIKDEESEYGSTLGEEYIQDGFWYRFPWPDEDRQTFRSHHGRRDYSRAFRFLIPRGLVNFPHNPSMCVYVHPHGEENGGNNINVFIPCPQSDRFIDSPDLYAHQGYKERKHDLIEVYMRIIREGQLQTVFRCPYCEQSFRLEDEDLAKITEHLKQYDPDRPGLYEEIATRIQPRPLEEVTA